MPGLQNPTLIGSPSPLGTGSAPGAAAVRRLIVARTVGSTASQTLSAPVAGTYRLVVVGPGGGGGIVKATRGTAQGGSSGGVSVSKPFTTTAGQTISISVGAGGAAVSASNVATASVAGNAGGGSTTATTPDGQSLSAGPGSGGGAIATAGSISSGPPGGNASGGEINQTGNSAQTGTSVNNATGTLGPLPIEVYTTPNGTVTSSIVLNGNILNSGYTVTAAASTPSAYGMIPNARGGAHTLVNAASITGVDATEMGAGSGATFTVNNGTGSISGGAGAPGGAYLILEAASLT